MVIIDTSLFFLIIIAAWIVYRFIRRIAAGKTSLIRELVVNGLFVYLLCVVYITFFPMIIILYAFDPVANFTPFVGSLNLIRYGNLTQIMLNLLGNILLFAPLGVFVPALLPATRRVWKILLVGFALSLGIECFQLLLKVRIFDIDDIILNTAGVLVGYGVFWVLSRIPGLSSIIAKLGSSERKSRTRSAFAYLFTALAVFLSIYSIQIIGATVPKSTIASEMSANNRQIIGMPDFGDFLVVCYQNDLGEKYVNIYRRVFFNRYTLFEWDNQLDMPTDTYSFSGMSTGAFMNYFIFVKSDREINRMISGGLNSPKTYPVTTLGNYHFSYARQALNKMDPVDTFGFLNQAGEKLNISVEQ